MDDNTHDGPSGDGSAPIGFDHLVDAAIAAYLSRHDPASAASGGAAHRWHLLCSHLDATWDPVFDGAAPDAVQKRITAMATGILQDLFDQAVVLACRSDDPFSGMRETPEAVVEVCAATADIRNHYREVRSQAGRAIADSVLRMLLPECIDRSTTLAVLNAQGFGDERERSPSP